MNKYIDTKKLTDWIEKRQEELSDHNFHSMAEEYDNVLFFITSFEQSAEWSEEDEWKRNELLKYLEEKGDYRSVWYSWLKVLPERFNLWQKQAFIEKAISWLENNLSKYYELTDEDEYGNKLGETIVNVFYGQAVKDFKTFMKGA